MSTPPPCSESSAASCAGVASTFVSSPKRMLMVLNLLIAVSSSYKSASRLPLKPLGQESTSCDDTEWAEAAKLVLRDAARVMAPSRTSRSAWVRLHKSSSTSGMSAEAIVRVPSHKEEVTVPERAEPMQLLWTAIRGDLADSGNDRGSPNGCEQPLANRSHSSSVPKETSDVSCGVPKAKKLVEILSSQLGESALTVLMAELRAVHRAENNCFSPTMLAKDKGNEGTGEPPKGMGSASMRMPSLTLAVETPSGGLAE